MHKITVCMCATAGDGLPSFTSQASHTEVVDDSFQKQPYDVEWSPCMVPFGN